jgi:hypothetical protein
MRTRISRDRRTVSPDRLRVESLEARALMAVVAGVPDLLPESDSGISSTDNKTNVSAPTFQVRAPRAEGVTLFRVGDAEPLGTGVPGAKPGTWVVTSRALPDGVHTIRAQAAGSTRLSAPLRVEIRTSATVAPATVDLCGCTDSGVKGDGVTNAATPRFVGTAPARAVVNLAVDGGTSLGTTRANARGAWALVARKPVLPDGEYVIRATATDIFGNEAGAGTVAATIDRAKPTALIEVTGIDSFRVTFSKPVTGFTSALRGMTFSGRPVGGAPISLPFSSPQLRRLVGPVVFTASEGGRVYNISLPEFGPESGTYTLRLAARGSSVVDAVAGNALAADATTSFTVA